MQQSRDVENKTSPIKLKQSTTTRLKDYQRRANRVRALLSFGKLGSLQECLNELNLETSILNDYSSIQASEKIAVSDFNNLSKKFEEILIERWERESQDKKTKEQDFKFDSLYLTKDFEIESLEWTGRIEDVKSAHQRNIEFLESFIPPTNQLQKGKCLYFQKEWALEAFYEFTQNKKLAYMLRANTGDGKTYAAGQLIRWILDSKFLDPFTISPWKILFVTGASIIDQSREVLEEEFGLDCVNTVHVFNYESLRSSFGLERFLERKVIVERNEEHEIWQWKPLVHPAMIVWDECHKLKNEGSIQSKIAQATNNLDYVWPFSASGEKAKIIQLFMSASPFSRVYHAKAFACATRHKIGNRIVTNKNWKDIANAIIAPADPQEYSKVAIRKFLREFKPYISTFKNVRRKHKAILNTEILDFRNEDDAKKYHTAWDRFLERKKQIEGQEYGNSQFLILVELLVFRMAASMLKHWDVTQRLYRVWQEGKAPVFACPFKPTIAKIVLNLVNDFNIPREKISVIWGGNQAYAGTPKSRFSPAQIQDILMRAIADPQSVSLKTIKAIHSQLQAEQEGLTDIPAELKLGMQTKEQRNIERKRFQSGKSEFCLFTFGAGKEGLSLHQNEDWLRPRRQYNDTTYNEMEMLQAEGRTARITSKSDTEITTLAYRDTIEVPVLRRVMAKRECLNIVNSHGLSSVEKDYSEHEKMLNKILEIVGLESGSEEDEELEESVFEELENEN